MPAQTGTIEPASAIAEAQARNPRYRPEGTRLYRIAISKEIGDSMRKQTQGLVKAGVIPPLTEASAA